MLQRLPCRVLHAKSRLPALFLRRLHEDSGLPNLPLDDQSQPDFTIPVEEQPETLHNHQKPKTSKDGPELLTRPLDITTPRTENPLFPVPDLPGMVELGSGKYTPWLTKRELKQYVAPLLAAEWRIEWLGHRLMFRLAGSFPALAHGRAMRLIKDIDDIARSENHHPESFGYSANTVSVTIATHQAVTARGAINPGLTIRDVRFATQLSNRFRENYSPITPRKSKTELPNPSPKIRLYSQDLMRSAGLEFKDARHN